MQAESLYLKLIINCHLVQKYFVHHCAHHRLFRVQLTVSKECHGIDNINPPSLTPTRQHHPSASRKRPASIEEQLAVQGADGLIPLISVLLGSLSSTVTQQIYDLYPDTCTKLVPRERYTASVRPWLGS